MKKKSGIIFPLLAVLLFSFCEVLLVEYIQKKEIASLIQFAASKAGVVFFCTILMFFFTMALVFITKSVFAGSIMSGIFAYILACIEYFKYNISGSHLVVADLGFVSNFGEIAGFADIKPEMHLVYAFFALALLVVAMHRVKMHLPRTTYRSVAGSAICILVIMVLISPSSATEKTYSILDFDTEPALTTMSMNERFENDGFLGFLSQNATEHMDADVEHPCEYSGEYMKRLSSGNPGIGDGGRPNVVIIASESFSDLRKFDESLVPDYIYDAYDDASKLGAMGKCMLPTFGGYTVRSEFELLFGLPSLAMSNPPSPHSLLDEEREQNTTVGIYNENGYKTTYIHAFGGDFYNRNEMYAQYGFDRLIFEDEFGGEEDLFRRYIDDGAVMRKVQETLQNDAEPSFVFAMTMQNHQPYISDDGDVSDELEYYLDGVERSSEALYEFFGWLKNFEEDTVVLFVGDHLPFFTPQGGVYESLGAYDEEPSRLYEQEYILYSNSGEVSCPKSEISLFYLPHILIKEAGLRYGAFTSTMLEIMKNTPVYSVARNVSQNEALDAITYDRTLGECWIK